MKTLQLTLLALTFAAASAFAQAKDHPKMKATKDCGTCCKQGGDCCDKCAHDKCGPCCDKAPILVSFQGMAAAPQSFSNPL